MSYKHIQLLNRIKKNQHMNFSNYQLEKRGLETIIDCFNHYYEKKGT